MMDATAMYPRGFHPMREMSLPDISGFAPVLHRIDVPVKYYFIDFGISTQFAPDQHPRLVLGMEGLDKDVPELSATVPYDPFKTDIFIIGSLLSEQFLEVRAPSRPYQINHNLPFATARDTRTQKSSALWLGACAVKIPTGARAHTKRFMTGKPCEDKCMVSSDTGACAPRATRSRGF